MAVLEEQVSQTCVRHYSDKNYKLRQIETGNIYYDAIDVIPRRYTYEETSELIPVDEINIEDSEALNIILGGV